MDGILVDHNRDMKLFSVEKGLFVARWLRAGYVGKTNKRESSLSKGKDV